MALFGNKIGSGLTALAKKQKQKSTPNIDDSFSSRFDTDFADKFATDFSDKFGNSEPRSSKRKLRPRTRSLLNQIQKQAKLIGGF